MRINKFLFPVLLLIIFFGVIALGMAAGYWETRDCPHKEAQAELPGITEIAPETGPWLAAPDSSHQGDQAEWLA